MYRNRSQERSTARSFDRRDRNNSHDSVILTLKKKVFALITNLAAHDDIMRAFRAYESEVSKSNYHPNTRGRNVSRMNTRIRSFRNDREHSGGDGRDNPHGDRRDNRDERRFDGHRSKRREYGSDRDDRSGGRGKRNSGSSQRRDDRHHHSSGGNYNNKKRKSYSNNTTSSEGQKNDE